MSVQILRMMDLDILVSYLIRIGVVVVVFITFGLLFFIMINNAIKHGRDCGETLKMTRYAETACAAPNDYNIFSLF